MLHDNFRVPCSEIRLLDSDAWIGVSLLDAGERGHRDHVTGITELRGGRIMTWTAMGVLYAWEAAAGSLIARLDDHLSEVRGLIQLANDDILSWSKDGTLRIWTGNSFKVKAVLDAGVVDRVIELSSGKILSYGRDLPHDRLIMWSESTEHARNVELKGHQRRIVGVEELSNGRVLSWDNVRILIWDVESKEDEASWGPSAVLTGHVGVKGVQELENGKFVSWSHDTLQLWDSNTGDCLKVCNVEAGNLECLGSELLARIGAYRHGIWWTQTFHQRVSIIDDSGRKARWHSPHDMVFVGNACGLLPVVTLGPESLVHQAGDSDSICVMPDNGQLVFLAIYEGKKAVAGE